MFSGVEAFCLRTSDDATEDFSQELQTMLRNCCLDWSNLPCECDFGCVEYKWRLGPEHTAQRVERLTTQMRFRLAEGDGTAFYFIGVRDSGVASGLSIKEHTDAVRVLMEVARSANALLWLEALSNREGSRVCSLWQVTSIDSTHATVTSRLHLDPHDGSRLGSKDSRRLIWKDAQNLENSTGLVTNARKRSCSCI